MKILDLVGRALVRYFKRPATSVPPQSGPNALPRDLDAPVHKTPIPQVSFPDRPTGPTKPATFDDLMASLRGFNAEAPDFMDRLRQHESTNRPAIADEVERRLAALDIPDDADEDTIADMAREALADMPNVHIGGVMRASKITDALRGPDLTTINDPDNMTWSEWQSFMKTVNAPAGWSTCRFGARWGDETCGMMFGITRGDFGIYTKEFYVCSPVHEGKVLAALIHLPTGTGVGVFLTAEQAIEAAELAMALGGVNWRTSIDPTRPDTWSDIRVRMGQAWEASGLHVAPFHAHDHGTDGEIAIWMSTNATRQAGKPEKEKLS